MVVLYAGDNDIAGGKLPEEVAGDFKVFVQKIQTALPKARIAFIAIKPSPSRWNLAEKIKAANRMIESFCRRDERLVYIDVFQPMLQYNRSELPSVPLWNPYIMAGRPLLADGQSACRLAARCQPVGSTIARTGC